MTSQPAFGLFQYVPGLAHGDPYEKTDKTRINGKTKGKQFSIKGPKAGKTVDVYFDATVASSVYVGSKYTTLSEVTTEYQKAKKQKQIVPTPFKPSTPRAGATGVANEYKYESNPPLPRASRESVAPFKPSSPAKRGLFSQDCHVTFTPISYANEGPAARLTRSSDGVKPFRPAHVILNKGPVGRIYGTVNPFPEYQPQGTGEIKQKSGETDKIVGKVFRPTSTPKSMRSYSIANMPRNSSSAF